MKQSRSVHDRNPDATSSPWATSLAGPHSVRSVSGAWGLGGAISEVAAPLLGAFSLSTSLGAFSEGQHARLQIAGSA